MPLLARQLLQHHLTRSMDGVDETVEEDQTKTGNVKDPEWRWPTREKWYSMLEGVWKMRRTTKGKGLQDGLQCPFEVTALIKERSEELSEVNVTIHSPYLITILRKYLSGMVGDLCTQEPSIDVKDLFGIWDSLKGELKVSQSECHCKEEATEDGINGVAVEREGSNAAADGNVSAKNDGSGVANGVSDGEEQTFSRLHLHHLLRFLDEHFKDISAKFAWVKREGRVSYNMLWTFLAPGVEVCCLCNISGQVCHAVISEKGKYDHKSWAPDENGFKIKLNVMAFNGKSYRHCTMTYKIDEFDGEVLFTSLRVCPWSFFPSQQRQDMMDHLEQRGQLFYNYAVKEPFMFMHFHGSLGYYQRSANGCFQLRRVNADGRVMVDLLSLAKANPDWPLGNAQPPSELLRGLGEKGTEEAKSEKGRQLTKEELCRAPAVVYGFSFSLKRWGCFDVEGLREITFEDQAYEQLVMKSAKQKEMLKAIVTTYLLEEGGRGKGVDVVAQKGEGCVVLCYGPPGTGKTLTAETLAETLHRPLWAISAFELGEEAGELEKSLSQVLNTALRWRAIVLLDEADGYLERRAFNVDVKRNLLTGVFLRLLEYYAGVLFLTTNRVGAFDEAFLSRISLCIRYPELDDERRGFIWQTLLARAAIPTNEANFSGLVQCGQPLNGREIRNIISLAQTWAHSSAQPPSISHVLDALQLVISGSKELLQDLGSAIA
ncbi:hypothetical protein GOP47_0016730 [Adiantum capillus-veneris]|uniref:AAA+ ATPase domain-containing protein n=1 Tax=Adiantum capillus-veneris TaxID=13818 RepID=A0A9D4UID0_ADICA|nr:hypothetical protein GOP47_0016730 [Adiantum capillus-veneris]